MYIVSYSCFEAHNFQDNSPRSHNSINQRFFSLFIFLLHSIVIFPCLKSHSLKVSKPLNLLIFLIFYSLTLFNCVKCIALIQSACECTKHIFNLIKEMIFLTSIEYFKSFLSKINLNLTLFLYKKLKWRSFYIFLIKIEVFWDDWQTQFAKLFRLATRRNMWKDTFNHIKSWSINDLSWLVFIYVLNTSCIRIMINDRPLIYWLWLQHKIERVSFL